MSSALVFTRSKQGELVPLMDISGLTPFRAGTEERPYFEESMSAEERDSRPFLYGEPSQGL